MSDYKDIENMIELTTTKIERLLDALDQNPAKRMTSAEARSAYDAMTEEEVFAIKDRERIAIESLRDAQADLGEWFKRKGQLATRILELQKQAVAPESIKTEPESGGVRSPNDSEVAANEGGSNG